MLALPFERWYSLALSQEPNPQSGLSSPSNGAFRIAGLFGYRPHQAGHEFKQRKSAAGMGGHRRYSSAAERCRFFPHNVASPVGNVIGGG